MKILFEECFYNSSDESYQVFCLDQPIEGGRITFTFCIAVSIHHGNVYTYTLWYYVCVALSDDIIISLENLEDCNRFLWSEAGSEKVRKSVDKLLEIFNLERGTSLRSIIVC